jgi:uncharacterized protein
VIASILLTLAVSAVAGASAARWRLPGGALMWALAAAAALHLTLPNLDAMPPAFRVAAQILIGVAIGATITRRPLRALYAVRWPLSFCTALLLAGSAACGFLLARLTPLDATTALFALAPGGANDMAVASLYFGVDAALVAACQVVRQLLVLVVVPLVFTLIPPGRRSDEE